jgi:biopolymer transport protein ExbD
MIEHKRRKLPIMVPIASFGDIAFLLIIFFMLASNFVKEAHIELERVQAGNIEEVEPAPVSVTMDVDGVCYLQGQVQPVGSLESAVSMLVEGAEDKRVAMTIDKNLTYKQYGEVQMALVRAGATIIAIGDIGETTTKEND